MKSKDTHTVEDLEKLLYEFIEMFKNAHTKEEKKVINTKRKNIERLLDTMREKHNSGKKYPMKKEPKEYNLEEVKALIEEVPDYPRDLQATARMDVSDDDIDVSGVSVGSNRFTFKE